MRDATLLTRIHFRPLTFGGIPVIRDTRISVELILSLLSQGASFKELLEDYPWLEVDDLHACFAYAHAVLTGELPVVRRDYSAYETGATGES